MITQHEATIQLVIYWGMTDVNKARLSMSQLILWNSGEALWINNVDRSAH
jgi:hypothetical protein